MTMMSSPENLGGVQAAPETARLVDDAVAQARAAATAAGVGVRALTDLADLEQVVGLFGQIWGRDANPPLSLELLRAFGMPFREDAAK